MKKEIKGFSRYWLVDDQKIVRKKTGEEVKVSEGGCIQLYNDATKKWSSYGLRRIIRLCSYDYKTFKDIEKEYKVKYKTVRGHRCYMFCQFVPDEYKVWSKYNDYFLTPFYVKNHLRFNLNRKTKFFYTIVWQYYNKRNLPKGKLIHHKDGNPDNNVLQNLKPMTLSEHTKHHHEW